MRDNTLSYVDNDGNKLYGYSQKSLDNNTLWIRVMVFIFGLLGLMFFGYLLWITHYIIKHNVINNFIANCIG